MDLRKKHLADELQPEAASMIWYSQVATGYLRPTSGTCLNVLSAASRTGDVKLAADVFRVLADRNEVFNNQHYEAMIQCYLVVHDLHAALKVVLIMQESNLQVTDEQLHPLYEYLTREKERPMDAFMQLQDLERSGRKIPTAAVNVCIAASIKLGDLPEAIEIYKALKSVAKTGPTTATFNELFRGCYMNGRKELAMYLANEMIELDIRPDRLTYDRLILTCNHAGDLDDAIGYFEEMRSEGMEPRRRTHEALIQLALEAKDVRCVALLKWYKAAEYRVEARVATLERQISKQFEESGESKKDVTKDEKIQDASKAIQSEGLGSKVKSKKKSKQAGNVKDSKGDSAQAALEALQEQMGEARTGTKTNLETVAQSGASDGADDASTAPSGKPEPDSVSVTI
jgi:pentatricopeptide repeat protein